ALAAAAVAAVLAVLAVAGSAFADAARPLVRGSGDAPSRVGRGLALGGLALLVVAAAVAFWQLRRYGSPVVADAAGTPHVDPLGVLAPVLALLALTALALLLNRPVAALFERVARRGRGLVPALPMRWLARRPGLYSAASFVAMLGVGGLTFAALLSGGWSALDARTAAVATGGEVRVVGTADASVDAIADAHGAAVLRSDVRVGGDPATLIALPASELGTVAPGTLEHPAEVAAALAPESSGAEAPLPVAVDAALAELAGVGVGDGFDLGIGAVNRLVPAEVAVVLPAVPGAGAPAVLADLDAFEAALSVAGGAAPPATERWLAADDPTAAAAAIDAARPSGS
ncbi:hypothetical protein GB864_17990, partial [Agromyces sp. MMS17-SY077]|nr:hypothetical protein [Agromyces seonyuensis]